MTISAANLLKRSQERRIEGKQNKNQKVSKSSKEKNEYKKKELKREEFFRLGVGWNSGYELA